MNVPPLLNMDQLGDLGLTTQLISTREENKVLHAKIHELTVKLKDLTITKFTLEAEVEHYRKNAALPTFSNLALGSTKTSPDHNTTNDASMEDFIISGNGIYPSCPAVSLPNLHGCSKPLCCAIHPNNDALLATGGSDRHVCIVQWGKALAPTPNAVTETVRTACRVQFTAPVLCLAFAHSSWAVGCDIVAAGCMDGFVQLIACQAQVGGQLQARVLEVVKRETIRHTKYVMSLAWAPKSNVLASASGDGLVQISKVTLVENSSDVMEDDDSHKTHQVTVDTLRTLHLHGAVETLCFVNHGESLCLFERGTSYLSYFDLTKKCQRTKYSLNGPETVSFDDHVSFAVMHLALSPNGKYLCAATDTSRNIIIEVQSSNILRNLYGVKNDGFSLPRIAWSQNGKYVFGNSQGNTSVLVWDVGSGSIVKRLDKGCGGHSGHIRDLCSSQISHTLVTVSYDMTVKVWLSNSV